MTQPSWTAESAVLEDSRGGSLKFIVAGVLMLIAVGFLITKAISNEGQFFITVNEYYASPTKYEGRDFRISAWVDGDSITFTQVDANTSRLEFDIFDDMANPTQKMHIVAMNEPLPDLLQHEAQAIVEGKIGADGAMYSNPDGLLLKCPTRYETGDPVQ